MAKQTTESATMFAWWPLWGGAALGPRKDHRREDHRREDHQRKDHQREDHQREHRGHSAPVDVQVSSRLGPLSLRV